MSDNHAKNDLDYDPGDDFLSRLIRGEQDTKVKPDVNEVVDSEVTSTNSSGASVMENDIAGVESFTPRAKDQAQILKSLLSFEQIEAPADLLDRTLDRCLVILPKSEQVEVLASESQAKAKDKDRNSAFRSSVEVLTRMPLGVNEIVPSRRTLFARLLSQSAAAVILCAGLSFFWTTFQPAYAHARATAIDTKVQSKLKRLHTAAMKYKAAVLAGSINTSSQAKTMNGRDLANRLIALGFADREDFLCPGVPKSQYGSIHFAGRLSLAEEDAKKPLFWDRFSNHGDRVNVVFHDGVVLSYSNNDFPKLFR